MASGRDSKVNQFQSDLENNEGYLYTTNAPLSSRLANRRCTDAVLSMADFRHKRVIDIGCGDGTYTVEFVDLARSASVCGIDVVKQAVVVARKNAGGHGQMTFAVASASELPYHDNSFDIAVLRGVLHHMPKPREALGEALRVAPAVVVVEPNGYNPGLKLFERFHPYHIAHHEMSYPPRTLDRWIDQLGGTVDRRLWAGLVPFVFPDRGAMILKKIEPTLEMVPLARRLGCAVYVFAARRQDGSR
jgi:SAM-dependent methyltransferase